MIFFVYVAESEGSIRKNLGTADYSYFFVKKLFVPALQKLGRVVEVDRLDRVDARYAAAVGSGEQAVLLSFTPPHKTPTGLACPTIPVFAWEYSTIPSEPWANDWRGNWAQVLSGMRAAITHSRFAQFAVKEQMGTDYPIVSLPAPLWDRFSELYRPESPPVTAQWQVQLNGVVLDSNALGFQSAHEVEAPSFSPKRQSVSFDGVIYTSVFNPNDGRKNWIDTLSAFCFAFRDQPHVTLLLKLAYFDSAVACGLVWNELRRNAPFRCRVVAIQGYLDGDDYQRLIANTTYVVNSAYGEGQCLPLMEFMSAGKPAVAPDHTGMADYISTDNAFVVRSSREWTHWPHDPRLVLRAFRYRINWESLRDAYLLSFDVAMNKPQHYQTMAASARQGLEEHCSQRRIVQGLKEFLILLGFEDNFKPVQQSWWRTSLESLIRGVGAVWGRISNFRGA